MLRAYDFDGTVYAGDSTVDFYLYCLTHVPSVITTIPGDAVDAIKFVAGLTTRQEFKERFFERLMPKIDADEVVRCFWASHRTKMKEWYLSSMEEGDVFLSASPEFILRPLLEELGITSILATKMDVATGRLLGPNMRGMEKVYAYRKAFPDETPDEFYTDSLSDLPMMRISKSSFLVAGSSIRRFTDTEIVEASKRTGIVTNE